MFVVPPTNWCIFTCFHVSQMYLYLFSRKPLSMSRPFYVYWNVCTVLVKPILAISCRFLSIIFWSSIWNRVRPIWVSLPAFILLIQKCSCLSDCNWTRTHSLWNAYVTWQEYTVFSLFVTIKLSSFKDTLLQTWESPYMFVFIWK